MMNLLDNKQKLSPDLSPREIEVVENSKLPRVKHSKKKDLTNLIADIVDTSIIVLGFLKTKYSKEERLVIENEIYKDIQTNFSHLSLKEIKQATSLGARGEFRVKGETVIFSVATVFNWIKSYCSIIRREALKKQSRFEQDQFKPEKPTRIMLLVRGDIFNQACIIAPYRHYLATDEYLFNNIGNVIYNKLDKLNLIPFPPFVKKIFMEKAKEHVLASLMAVPTTENQKIYEQVKAGKGKGHELVISQAKDIALREFFKDLKEQKADLEKLLKE
jgi:virulence-associated protein VapD